MRLGTSGTGVEPHLEDDEGRYEDAGPYQCDDEDTDGPSEFQKASPDPPSSFCSRRRL